MEFDNLSTSIPEISEWFDLNHYNSTIEYSAKDWYQALNIRNLNKQFLDLYLNGGQYAFYDINEVSLYLINYFSKIRDKVILTEYNLPLSRVAFSDCEDDISEQNELIKLTEKGLCYSHLRSLTYRDAIDIHSTLDNKFEEENYDSESKREEPLLYNDELFEYSIDMFPILHTLVDMSSTNDVLIEQFKMWLESARKYSMTNKNKTLTPTKLYNLRANKVLPFLDLKLWAGINKITFTSKELYKYLYPGKPGNSSEHSRIENRIKYIDDLANESLSLSYLSTLQNSV